MHTTFFKNLTKSCFCYESLTSRKEVGKTSYETVEINIERYKIEGIVRERKKKKGSVLERLLSVLGVGKQTRRGGSMPTFHTPDYVHLNGARGMTQNESAAQLVAPRSPTISVDDERTDVLTDETCSVSYRKPTFWQRRTGLEKALAILLLLVLSALFTVLLLLARPRPAGSRHMAKGTLHLFLVV